MRGKRGIKSILGGHDHNVGGKAGGSPQAQDEQGGQDAPEQMAQASFPFLTT